MADHKSPEQVNLRAATGPQNCAGCVMWTELQPGIGRCDFGFDSYATQTCDEYEPRQPDYSDGCMIALYPPPALARELAIDGGLDPGDMHVTIAYCGNAADVDADALTKAMQDAATGVPPFSASLSGHARFTGGDQDVIVALLDSPALDKLRAKVVAALAGQGIDIPQDHGFTAHMTIAYIGQDAPDPVGRLESKPVTFTTLTAVHAAARTSQAFDDAGLAAAAREAYGAGWALSGGPMTETVRAGAIAAVGWALDHYDDPGVLEATLQIGKLQGAWAKLFRRRELVTRKATKAVIAAIAAILAKLPVAALIDRLRADVPPGTTAYTDDYLGALTTQAAASLLAGVYAHDGHNDMAAVVQDALRQAMAEGQAGVQAVAAEQRGEAFSFGKAYQAVYDQLEHLPDLPLMSQQWVQQMLGGASRDLGGLLSRLTQQGTGKQDMITAVKQALDPTADGSITQRAVSAFLDQAMSQAMSQASISLYASEGAQVAYFVTAGDAAVCPICQQTEDGNPYTVQDVPSPGLHPFCRCVVTVMNPNLFGALAADVAYQDA